jgi:DNA modification methylase
MAFTLKRKFIGIEKEEEYLEIAKKRIGEVK